MLGLGFPYSPTQVGLTLLTVGVPTLFLTFWARPTPAGPAPAGQPRPVRPPRRAGHRGLRHGRLRLPLRDRLQVPQLGPHPGPGDQRLRELHGPDLHRRRLHRGGGHHRRPDRAVDLRLPRLVRADPVPRPAHPVLRRLDPPDRRPAARPCWSPCWSSRSAPCCSSPRSTTTSGSPRATGVLAVVLPALVLWFAALSAAYRFRLLDRVLGLQDRLPAPGAPNASQAQSARRARPRWFGRAERRSAATRADSYRVPNRIASTLSTGSARWRYRNDRPRNTELAAEPATGRSQQAHRRFPAGLTTWGGPEDQGAS